MEIPDTRESKPLRAVARNSLTEDEQTPQILAIVYGDQAF